MCVASVMDWRLHTFYRETKYIKFVRGGTHRPVLTNGFDETHNEPRWTNLKVPVAMTPQQIAIVE